MSEKPEAVDESTSRPKGKTSTAGMLLSGSPEDLSPYLGFQFSEGTKGTIRITGGRVGNILPGFE